MLLMSDTEIKNAGATQSLRHLAIIMDGNGRWAEARGLSRSEGHRRGAEVMRDVARVCAERGIEILSLYTFSTENWRRPAAEVNTLMKLIATFFKKYQQELIEEGVVCRFAGDLSGLSPQVQKIIREVKELTLEKPRMQLVILLNYGGRDEIIRAVRKLAKSVADGELKAEQLNEAHLSQQLDLPDLPDPDLIIRTGGELRLSNFWLWQSAYSELYFTNTLWPDFSGSDLDEALKAYAGRKRRFGALGR